ncbi:MAG: hypothetical protein HYT77_05500 [Deltaproteobacteria bacterium]|nr:hypothetical protein [Deltaproteobacteria bacterium]
MSDLIGTMEVGISAPFPGVVGAVEGYDRVSGEHLVQGAAWPLEKLPLMIGYRMSVSQYGVSRVYSENDKGARVERGISGLRGFLGPDLRFVPFAKTMHLRVAPVGLMADYVYAEKGPDRSRLEDVVRFLYAASASITYNPDNTSLYLDFLHFTIASDGDFAIAPLNVGFRW